MYSVKETIKKIAVFKEKGAENLINGEDTVLVLGIDQFGSHFQGTSHVIFCSAGRAKTAMIAERKTFKITTVRAGIHGLAKGRKQDFFWKKEMLFK